MTRQAIETRTRLLIAKEILERTIQSSGYALDFANHTRLLDALHTISRAAASLEQLND